MPSNTLLSDTYRGHGYCDAASLQRDERAVTMLYIIHKYFYLSTPLLVQPKATRTKESCVFCLDIL